MKHVGEFKFLEVDYDRMTVQHKKTLEKNLKPLLAVLNGIRLEWVTIMSSNGSIEVRAEVHIPKGQDRVIMSPAGALQRSVEGIV